jgi:arylsulfatase A-like enzyme
MQQFNSFEMIRGQESDPWIPAVEEPETPQFKGRNKRPNWAIRQHLNMEDESQYPTPKTFAHACKFLDQNHDADDWHLHVEVFDPHEPFLSPSKYRDMYDDAWDRDYVFDWPNYDAVDPEEEGEEAIEHIRKLYAATITMADAWLGKMLDKMDEYGMWDDTVVMLTTDHGHLLGEHGYWAKNYQFDYRELMNIPLFVYAPNARMNGKRVKALTSAVDLAPSVMELHGATPPEAVRGKSVMHLTEKDEHHHDVVLYGYWGQDIGMTDGRYTYSRQPRPKAICHEFTANLHRGTADWYQEVLKEDDVDFGPFLGWTDFPVVRVPVESRTHRDSPDFNSIYDLAKDPNQESPIHDEELEAELAVKMVEALKYHDAPECQYKRTGLDELMD